jgi:hypothetical protein|uniref:Uncharacterized protein n=1 Tax=viral metagenome TaxID=1070528 RepID=A0A6C0IX77_9ZZZZ
MDNNSPIYREKYLKYKNKYLELKSLEKNQKAGMFSSILSTISSASSSAAASLAKATGTDPQSYYNTSVMNLFKVQTTDVHTYGTGLVKGLLSAQQIKVTKPVYDMLAHGITGHGPVAKAIKGITGTHDSKGQIKNVNVLSPEDKLKEILRKELKTDNVMSYAKPLLLQGLAKVHTSVMSQVNTIEVKTENRQVNATSIKNLNDQIVVETLCNKMGLAVSACDKKKIDAAKHAFKELDTINKTKLANTKSAEIFAKTRDNAQKAMDDFATSLYKNIDPSASVPKSNVTSKELMSYVSKNEINSSHRLREKLNLSSSNDLLTKESLIKDFSNPAYHTPTDVKHQSKSQPASPKAAVDVPEDAPKVSEVAEVAEDAPEVAEVAEDAPEVADVAEDALDVAELI